MTGRETPSPDAVLHLLDEAGIAEDPALVRAVETIGSLGAGPAPEVTAELAQLMADGGKAPPARRNRRRITFIGGALAVSMGVGMSGVAAGTALTDGLTEAVESIARFSIRDDADRAYPLPGVLAGPGDGGRGIVAPVEIPAPSHTTPVPESSVAVPLPAPAVAGKDRAADGDSPTAGTGPAVESTAPRGAADAGRRAAPDARSAPAAPPAAVPPDGQAPPAAVPPAAAPPAAVPRSAAPPVAPVAPAGSSPAPERRSAPGPGSPVPGDQAPGAPDPGNGKAVSPVPGSGHVNAQGPEVRLLKQPQPGPPAGPAAEPRGKGGSFADAHTTPAPQGRVWLRAPASVSGPAGEHDLEQAVEEPDAHQPAVGQPEGAGSPEVSDLR